MQTPQIILLTICSVTFLTEDGLYEILMLSRRTYNLGRTLGNEYRCGEARNKSIFC